MGGEWALGRGDTSQERDKLVEVLSARRMVVILGGSEGDKPMYFVRTATADNLRLHLSPEAQFNLQSSHSLTDSICHYCSADS